MNSTEAAYTVIAFGFGSLLRLQSMVPRPDLKARRMNLAGGPLAGLPLRILRTGFCIRETIFITLYIYIHYGNLA